MADAERHLPGTPEALRAVMGRFASGVTVVTAVLGGVPHAMTATAVCSVSLDPPLVLVCVGKSSRFHPAVLAAGAWAMSVLAADQSGVAQHFADRGRDLTSQFDTVPHTSAPISGAPIIDGALAWLDLVTQVSYDAGDHTVVIGELRAAGHESEDREPLTYYQGAYRDAPNP